jgi:hypothetical protein
VPLPLIFIPVEGATGRKRTLASPGKNAFSNAKNPEMLLGVTSPSATAGLDEWSSLRSAIHSHVSRSPVADRGWILAIRKRFLALYFYLSHMYMFRLRLCTHTKRQNTSGAASASGLGCFNASVCLCVCVCVSRCNNNTSDK